MNLQSHETYEECVCMSPISHCKRCVPVSKAVHESNQCDVYSYEEGCV